MILQNQGQDHPLVVSQDAHMCLAEQLASEFGNDDFIPLTPHDEMMFVVRHHDHGWNKIDEELPFKEETGLPYNLVETPFSALMRTGPGSVEFCQNRSDYCGLLVSMHTYGLYTGRYGMSDKVYVDAIPSKDRPHVEDMLNNELSRQDQLKQKLLLDERWSSWVSEEMLFYNYKRLQFFDTLALYFNLDSHAERKPSVFKNVSMNLRRDVDIKVTPVVEGVYRVAPFPFRESGVTVKLDLLNIEPQREEASLGALLPTASTSVEDIKLIAGH